MSDLWKDTAAKTGLPVFPIKIACINGKWAKRPLTARGHLDASIDVDRFDWSAANGLGIRMGQGLYALDIDDYKNASAPKTWLQSHNVPTQTLAHKTVSGGAHLIYRVTEQFHDLPSRQNIVPGLDARGYTGWIAFGEGYEVQIDTDPLWLPVKACKAIHKGYSRQGPGRGMDPAQPVDDAELLAKLKRWLQLFPALKRRWEGDASGLSDGSASALDLSVAHLLAMASFDYSEIVAALLHHFPHGQARNNPRVVQPRAAMRCASRAVAYRDEQKLITQQALENKGMTEEQKAHLLRLISEGAV